ALGFLGLGVQPPTPEWGVMVSEGRRFITEQWWVSTFPGFAILLATLGFNLLGDGINDILNVRSRR
ncbi:MAG: D,D-dipeptide ABC transporter permease, partial [Candidatus Methanodesulfokora sp.]